MKTFIFKLKKSVKLFLLKIQYKSGYILSTVPKTFLKSKGLQINEGVNIGNWNIEIGNYCFVGKNTLIDNCKCIGNFSCISHNVNIGLVNHALDHISTNPFFYRKEKGWVKKSSYEERKGKEVEIGYDVLISANAIILEGVKIGTGAVIAAGAVVTKDVPPYAIVAGVPAKLIRYRFDEKLRKKLLDSKWWNMPKNALIKHSENFSKPEKFLAAISGNTLLN